MIHKITSAALYPIVVLISALFMIIDNDWEIISFKEWMNEK
jgi:hypothetical protein